MLNELAFQYHFYERSVMSGSVYFYAHQNITVQFLAVFLSLFKKYKNLIP